MAPRRSPQRSSPGAISFHASVYLSIYIYIDVYLYLCLYLYLYIYIRHIYIIHKYIYATLAPRRSPQRSSPGARPIPINLSTHLFIYLHVYLYLYLYLYLGLTRGSALVPAVPPSSPAVSSSHGTLALGFTRYSFTPNISSTSQSSCDCPLHLHCSHYCNTIARPMRNIRALTRPPLRMPYTIQHWQWQYIVNAKLAHSRASSPSPRGRGRDRTPPRVDLSLRPAVVVEMSPYVTPPAPTYINICMRVRIDCCLLATPPLQAPSQPPMYTYIVMSKEVELDRSIDQTIGGYSRINPR